MALFGKKSDNKPRQFAEEMKRVEDEAISSIIDKGMTITGEISFQGKVRIDGMVEGNVKGEHLILSDTGEIYGDIQASSFNCYGVVNGNIEASILNLRKGCNVTGALDAKTLTVEPGAAMMGDLKVAMTREEEEEEKLLPEAE